MLFIEETSPPPFYQKKLTPEQRKQLDKWFIGKRSQAYYLKRFDAFDKQGYLSAKWHWAAFFVTFGWLLYRKRYLDSIVYTVAGWSFIQLNIVIILAMLEFALIPFVPDTYQMLTRIGIAGIIWVFWAFMVARWSDAYYYRMARREIADALEYYPQEPEKQKAHLQREGGVSQVGLGIAFGLFGFLLLVLQVQFLPLYAKPKATGIITEAYQVTTMATKRVDAIYQQTGRCPTNMPFSANDQKVSITVSQTSPALGKLQSDCVVTGRLHNIPFPNRNLNDQQFVLYRVPLQSPSSDSHIEPDQTSQHNVKWQCVTSFNKKQTPVGCRTRS